MSLVNAWLEYRDRECARGTKKKDILDLLGFQDHSAQAFCKAELNPNRPRGRPSFSSLLNYTPVPAKKIKAAVLPVSEVRYDGFDHLPEVATLKSAQRCKLEHCDKEWKSKVPKMYCVLVFDW